MPGQDEDPVVVGDDGRLGDERVLPRPVVVGHGVAEGDALHADLLSPEVDKGDVVTNGHIRSQQVTFGHSWQHLVTEN